MVQQKSFKHVANCLIACKSQAISSIDETAEGCSSVVIVCELSESAVGVVCVIKSESNRVSKV